MTAMQTNGPAPVRSATAPAESRVCVVSQRQINRLAGWCSNYEFEDVLSSVEGVDLFQLAPGRASQARDWLVRRLYFRPGLRNMAAQMNPGLQEIHLQKDYEAFVFVCGKLSDLIFLRAIKGWRDRCRIKVCIIVELFTGMFPQYGFHLGLLKDFDHVVLNFTNPLEPLRKLIGRPCHHVPLGVDVLRFTPYPNPPARCIDIYSMGRRVEEIHRALLKLASRREVFYIHDTIPGALIQPVNHREHRDLVANFAKRSRFFIAYPAKVDCADETRGLSEVGARFFEGAASGAVLMGQAPTNPVFARDFDWPDAVVEVGSQERDLLQALDRFRAEPELLEALSRKSAVAALRGFDWVYRWRQILEIVGLQPMPALKKRVECLENLAQEAEGRSRKVAAH